MGKAVEDGSESLTGGCFEDNGTWIRQAEEGFDLSVVGVEGLEPGFPGVIKIGVPVVEVLVDFVLGGVEWASEAVVGEVDAFGVVAGEERGDVGLDFLGGERWCHGFDSV